MSNNLAVNVPSLNAAVAFYGRQPSAEDTTKIKAAILKAKIRVSKGSELSANQTFSPALSTCHHATLCTAAKTTRPTMGAIKRAPPIRHDPSINPWTIHRRARKNTADSNSAFDHESAVPYGIAVSTIMTINPEKITRSRSVSTRWRRSNGAGAGEGPTGSD